MPQKRLIGPYARQVTHAKLKFWFALESGAFTTRYEFGIRPGDKGLKERARPEDPKPSRSYSNFPKQKLPDDLESYPSIAYPRFHGDSLGAAAASMLVGEDRAAFLRLRLTNELPSSRPR